MLVTSSEDGYTQDYRLPYHYLCVCGPRRHLWKVQVGTYARVVQTNPTHMPGRLWVPCQLNRIVGWNHHSLMCKLLHFEKVKFLVLQSLLWAGLPLDGLHTHTTYHTPFCWSRTLETFCPPEFKNLHQRSKQILWNLLFFIIYSLRYDLSITRLWLSWNSHCLDQGNLSLTEIHPPLPLSTGSKGTQ